MLAPVLLGLATAQLALAGPPAAHWNPTWQSSDAWLEMYMAIVVLPLSVLLVLEPELARVLPQGPYQLVVLHASEDEDVPRCMDGLRDLRRPVIATGSRVCCATFVIALAVRG